MYLFLLAALPAFCFGWLFSQPKYERNSFIPPLLWGSLSAVLVCTIKAFFVFSNYVWTISFFSGFIHVLFKDVLLPCVILYALFFFISKDDNEYKADSFLPLMASFYAIYIPYRVLSMDEPLSVFPLFVKPVLFVSLVSFLSSLLHRIFDLIEEEEDKKVRSKKLAKLIGFVLLAVCIPAMLEAWWHLGGKLYFIIPLAVIYAALAFVVYLKFKKDTTQEPVFMTM
jgi:hypothetical protein